MHPAYVILSKNILNELFDKKNPSYSDQVTEDFLYCIADEIPHKFDQFKIVLDTLSVSVKFRISQALAGPSHAIWDSSLCAGGSKAMDQDCVCKQGWTNTLCLLGETHW